MLREGSLHAAIKVLLAEPGDRLEVPVGRFVVDLVRADGEMVEVQTGGFGALIATVLNVGAALALHERRADLNMRSALLTVRVYRPVDDRRGSRDLGRVAGRDKRRCSGGERLIGAVGCSSC